VTESAGSTTRNLEKINLSRSPFQLRCDIIGDAYCQRQHRQRLVTESLRSTFRNQEKNKSLSLNVSAGL
jgi:hypothetical protein